VDNIIYFNRLFLSAVLYFIISILTITNAFINVYWLMILVVVLILLFILLEFRNIPIRQRITGLTLFTIGALAAYSSNTLHETMINGIARSQVFLLLFFAIAWLQVPVSRSPSLKSVRDLIMNQPSGRRFFVLSIGVHSLGSLLNLAALGLLTPILEDRSDEVRRRRLSIAIMHGFTSATAWSPFFISMPVVLVAIPSITWENIAVEGMAMSFVMILGAWIFDRIRHPRMNRIEREPFINLTSPVRIYKSTILLLSLIASVMLTLKLTSLSIPIALGIACPPFGVIWYITQRQQPSVGVRSLTLMAQKVIIGFSNLRNEALVFVAANVFGIGIASVIPTENLAIQLGIFLPSLDARIICIAVIFILSGFIGLHPIIVVLTLGSILSPEVIGLRDWVLALTYLGCWGLAIMISPYSGTTLFMSRFTGVPSHIIGWKWSPYSVCFNAILMITFIIILRHLFP
jgi:hypothetical protein